MSYKIADKKCPHLDLRREKGNNVWWCIKCASAFVIEDVTQYLVRQGLQGGNGEKLLGTESETGK